MLCLSESIRPDDPSLQQGLQSAYHAANLTELIVAAWALARVMAVQVVESVLKEWAGRPTTWPPCPTCGTTLHSKGLAKREVKSLLGVIRWRRRVGRCPEGCEIGQVAPLDEALGLAPYQRSSGELQYLGCSLAVFVPYATAAQLLRWYSASSVSARAVWCWTQAAGARAMSTLQSQLEALASGQEPQEEALEQDLKRPLGLKCGWRHGAVSPSL